SGASPMAESVWPSSWTCRREATLAFPPFCRDRRTTRKSFMTIAPTFTAPTSPGASDNARRRTSTGTSSGSFDNRDQMGEGSAVVAGARSAPHLRGYPLVGVIPSLFRDPVAFCTNAVEKYGDFVSLDLGFSQGYIVCHPA